MGPCRATPALSARIAVAAALAAALGGCADPAPAGHDGGTGAADACIPLSCADEGACGEIDDGCGSTLECEACCVPVTCLDRRTSCGDIDDGCGQSLSCGECQVPTGCGAREAGVCSVTPSARVCNSDGWCWENPLPRGQHLRSIHGSGTEVWAVGDAGIALRLQAGEWVPVETGTFADLRGVFVAAPGDVWIVGDSYLGRHDGDELVTLAPPASDLRAIHGTGSEDVWVASSVGMHHFNGDGWTSSALPGGRPEAIFARTASDVWAVTYDGEVMHYDGSPWTVEDIGASYLTEVYAPSAGTVYVGGSSDLVRVDGEWQHITDTTGVARAIWGTGGDVWITGHFHGEDGWAARRSGGAWTDVAIPLDISALWGSGPDDIWGVGRSGAIAHWDGASWQGSAGAGRTRNLEAVWGADADDVWVAGKVLLRWNGGGFVDYSEQVDRTLYGIWGSGADDVWAVGQSPDLYHFDGQAWSEIRPDLDIYRPSFRYTAVWGASADDVYFAASSFGDTFIIHYDGTEFRVVQEYKSSGFGFDLVTFTGSGSEDIWAAGTRGTLLHFDGEAWQSVSGPLYLGTIDDLWLDPDGTLWAAADDLYRREANGSWTPIAGLGPHVRQVAGRAANDIWALDINGAAWHYDGETWNESMTGAGDWLFGLAVLPQATWAVGWSGAALVHEGG